ncbi:MAG: sigma 54-interacting transcriptional regulator, partial [Syntrophomonadaceae bacterium]|nr:sigma 54-interacting transcriptional regulator [Syntrophomonadaceae bacterium]
LREKGECEGIIVSQEIRDSWARSRAYGVDPFKRKNHHVLSAEELEERRIKNRALLEEATVSMQNLFKFTEGSGFAFTVADGDGYLLKRIGDKWELEFTAGANFSEGANWSEQVMGTNAVGLALALGKPVQVFGYEHYCLCATVTTCSASPIFDGDGNIIGVLDITGPFHLVNRHTLGMAVAGARAIERQLALYQAYQQSEMANRYKSIIMESMSDGVLTLDQEGKVTHINALGGRYLGIDPQTALGKQLSDLVPPENQLFLAKLADNRKLCSEPLVVRKRDETTKLAVSSTPMVDCNEQVVGKVVILQAMQQYKRLIKRVAGARANVTFENIIGKSSSFKNVVKHAEMAAASDSHVLLLGESGTGKDLFAQAIHNASSRASEPFFAINCAALPRELVSSELFGYEEGAFTGARKGGNPGKFELADQGTIFLDEIGEMPLDLQGSLLRVLEEGTIVRLGGTEIIPVNVRVIAATNKNLMDEVRKGRFRLDLYYRLGVIVIQIPPLRERKGDIPELVEHFIQTISPRLGKKVARIEDRAMDVLLGYDWPGNVRELNNVIERAINMMPGEVITVDVLPPDIIDTKEEYIPVWEKTPSRDNVEEQLIRNYLRKFKDNKSRVAKELGISRSSLYRKMEKYSII